MDEQKIVQRAIQKFRESRVKLDDVLAMREEGASLEDLHPDMDDEALREYGVELGQFAEKRPWIGQVLEDE